MAVLNWIVDHPVESLVIVWLLLSAVAATLRAVVQPGEGSRLDAILDLVEAWSLRIRSLAEGVAKLRGSSLPIDRDTEAPLSQRHPRGEP